LHVCSSKTVASPKKKKKKEGERKKKKRNIFERAVFSVGATRGVTWVK
jgi:hypothetical protein